MNCKSWLKLLNKFNVQAGINPDDSSISSQSKGSPEISGDIQGSVAV